MIRSRRGQIPLKVMIAMFIAMIALLAWNTWRDTRSTSSDGRQEVVAWGITFFGEDHVKVVHSDSTLTLFGKSNVRAVCKEFTIFACMSSSCRGPMCEMG